MPSPTGPGSSDSSQQRPHAQSGWLSDSPRQLPDIAEAPEDVDPVHSESSFPKDTGETKSETENQSATLEDFFEPALSESDSSASFTAIRPASRNAASATRKHGIQSEDPDISPGICRSSTFLIENKNFQKDTSSFLKHREAGVAKFIENQEKQQMRRGYSFSSTKEQSLYAYGLRISDPSDSDEKGKPTPLKPRSSYKKPPSDVKPHRKTEDITESTDKTSGSSWSKLIRRKTTAKENIANQDASKENVPGYHEEPSNTRERDLEDQVRLLNQTLEKKDIELRELREQEKLRKAEVTKLESIARRNLVQFSSVVNNESPGAQDTWKSLFEEKKAECEGFQRENERLRALLIRYDGPKLKAQIDQLTSHIKEITERYQYARSERNKWKKKAEDWEEENKSMRELRERTQDELANRVKEMNAEMTAYVADYYEKLPDNDPQWWEVRTLQAKVRELTDDLNVDKEKIEKLISERDEAREAYGNLRKAMEEGNDIYYSSRDDYSHVKKIPKPRYMSPQETRKRENVIQSLQTEQSRARADRAVADELVEKARKHKLGKYYPPGRSGYDELATKSAWKLWEGDAFLHSAEATDEDWENAARLGLRESRAKGKMPVYNSTRK